MFSKARVNSGLFDHLHNLLIVFSKKVQSRFSGTRVKLKYTIKKQNTFIYTYIIPSCFSGLVLCIFSGILYGQTFTPATYVQDNYHDASTNGKNMLL